VACETLGPEMRSCFGVYELRIDAHAIAAALHAAFHDVAHAKFAPNLPRIYCFALVGEGGVACDTNAPGMRDRSVVKLSVMPSTK
jgi:hypothetical protein